MRNELVYPLEPFSTDFDSDRVTFSEIKLVHSLNAIKFTNELYHIAYMI